MQYELEPQETATGSGALDYQQQSSAHQWEPGPTPAPPTCDTDITAGAADRFHVLHETFEAQVDRRAADVAVEFGRERITYGGLDRRANRIARCLRGRGVGRGSRVALFLPRSPDLYAALLGILKAGAAYVPLDPDYPADRVAYILADSRAQALLTVSDLAKALPAFRARRSGWTRSLRPLRQKALSAWLATTRTRVRAIFATLFIHPVRPAGPKGSWLSTGARGIWSARRAAFTACGPTTAFTRARHSRSTFRSRRFGFRFRPGLRWSPQLPRRPTPARTWRSF